MRPRRPSRPAARSVGGGRFITPCRCCHLFGHEATRRSRALFTSPPSPQTLASRRARWALASSLRLRGRKSDPMRRGIQSSLNRGEQRLTTATSRVTSIWDHRFHEGRSCRDSRHGDQTWRPRARTVRAARWRPEWRQYVLRRHPDSSKVPPLRLNVRAVDSMSKRPPEATSSRLGGHYSATRAPLADWLQRDEFRGDFGI
jgi:hypothetical protein